MLEIYVKFSLKALPSSHGEKMTELILLFPATTHPRSFRTNFLMIVQR